MAIDRKSLGFRLIFPSFFFIAIVFVLLFLLIRNITDTVQKDYSRFAISTVSGEVQKILSNVATELTRDRITDQPVVSEAKKRTVLEEISLLWGSKNHDGVVADATGAILFSSVEPARARLILNAFTSGFYQVPAASRSDCYAVTFPAWGWKIVTIGRPGNGLMTPNRVVILIPLVAAGCLLLVVGIFLLIRKTVRDPVLQMVAAVDRGEPVPATELTELDIIGGAVNEAIQRLKERSEALQHELLERTRVQREIRAKDEHIRRLLDYTEEGIFGVDRKGICTFCNRSCLALLGYEREEQLLGNRIHDLIHHTHDDGTPFPERECSVHQGLLSGENVHVDGEIFWRSDKTPLQVEYWSHPIVDNGSVTGAVTTFIDVSERKLLEDQLIQAQKMESIGRLAGGVAHDFNNLLTPIICYSELLKMSLNDGGKTNDMVDNVLKASEKAKDLVQQLLSFSRKQVLEMRILDLNEVITDFQGILRHAIRESIELRFHLVEDRYGIRADQNKLEQVIMNLAINAQDAIGEQGVITVETSPVTVDKEYARQHQDMAPGRYLMLTISDDGLGMDQDTQQRIFEPFFTTKEIGKGTGLGLATVYGIVRQHGGNIWVYSEKGRGTTFKCYFPLVEELPSYEPQPAAAQFSLFGQQRTILLVEDDEMIRELVDEMLSEQGFEMLVAENPKEALKILGTRSLDLLITDVVMPHMSGPELHDKLVKTRPGLKVLYMSGYTGNAVAKQVAMDENSHFIQKPFAVDEFARTVESVLTS